MHVRDIHRRRDVRLVPAGLMALDDQRPTVHLPGLRPSSCDDLAKKPSRRELRDERTELHPPDR